MIGWVSLEIWVPNGFVTEYNLAVDNGSLRKRALMRATFDDLSLMDAGSSPRDLRVT